MFFQQGFCVHYLYLHKIFKNRRYIKKILIFRRLFFIDPFFRQYIFCYDIYICISFSHLHVPLEIQNWFIKISALVYLLDWLCFVVFIINSQPQFYLSSVVVVANNFLICRLGSAAFAEFSGRHFLGERKTLSF